MEMSGKKSCQGIGIYRVATGPGKPGNQGNVGQKIISGKSGNFEICQGNFVWLPLPITVNQLTK
jgi:hypothetical protein